MKYAADFRYIAREALRGRWLTAVITAFIASLIGGRIVSSGVSVSSDSSSDSGFDLQSYFSSEVWSIFQKVLFVLLIYAVVKIIIAVIIGGAAKLGYARFNLNLVDGIMNARIDDLFSQLYRISDGFVMNFLMFIYTFLWSLLFVIPGIIKSISYSMTPYILSEHPEYSPNYAITLSKEMMYGHKWRLFCLHFSFMGWSLLAVLPAIIALVSVLNGNFLLLPLILVTVIADLFLGAYMEAANAAFYREVSGTEDQIENIYFGE